MVTVLNFLRTTQWFWLARLFWRIFAHIFSIIFARVASAAGSALTSAMKHSRRRRCLRDPSHHLGRLRRVDICDEAFAPTPIASVIHRFTVARAPRVDICDIASALSPLQR
jgi:hypothetical protein